MSSVEGVFSWLGDWQWLCMVTLFLASVVTLIVYLVLYFFNESPVGKTPLSHVDSEEADGILCWVLSLKSWKSQWRRAWFRSLNEEARRSQVVVVFLIQLYLYVLCIFNTWAPKMWNVVIFLFLLLCSFGNIFLLLERDSADIWRRWCSVIRTGCGSDFKLYENTQSKSKVKLWTFIHTNLYEESICCQTSLLCLPACLRELYIGLIALNQNRVMHVTWDFSFWHAPCLTIQKTY